jgi:pheromone a factor receptor
MALAMTEMMCTTPLAIFVIWLNATTTTIGPWRSWNNTHLDYSRVEQIPGVLWRSNHLLVVSMELTRWTSPFCAIVFFIFFGFAQEARKNYRMVFDVAAKRFGFTPRNMAQSSHKSTFG